MRAGVFGLPLFLLPSRGERSFHLAGSGEERQGKPARYHPLLDLSRCRCRYRRFWMVFRQVSEQ
jgi:hypothetical protein